MKLYYYIILQFFSIVMLILISVYRDRDFDLINKAGIGGINLKYVLRTSEFIII